MVQGFAEKIIQSQGALVRLITGREDEKDVWFYLLLHSENYPEYQRQVKSGNMDNIRNYGQILFCGTGKEPPEVIRQVIRERYLQG